MSHKQTQPQIDTVSVISSLEPIQSEFDLTQEPDVFSDARLSAIFASKHNLCWG